MPFSGLSRSDPGGVWLLPQVDFRASTAEPDFVHHGAHQEDAAAVSCGLLFWSGGIYKGLRIEARAVVANGDVDTAIRTAAARYVDTLLRVLAIAMDDGIDEGFT